MRRRAESPWAGLDGCGLKAAAVIDHIVALQDGFALPLLIYPLMERYRPSTFQRQAMRGNTCNGASGRCIKGRGRMLGGFQAGETRYQASGRPKRDPRLHQNGSENPRTDLSLRLRISHRRWKIHVFIVWKSAAFFCRGCRGRQIRVFPRPIVANNKGIHCFAIAEEAAGRC